MLESAGQPCRRLTCAPSWSGLRDHSSKLGAVRRPCICCMQVAAVDQPKVHLWETGITRITRHPQNTGQLIWCLGHLLWIGNSFMVTTSAALVAHHVFACYHGDFRLRRKHGEVSLYYFPSNPVVHRSLHSCRTTAVFKCIVALVHLSRITEFKQLQWTVLHVPFAFLQAFDAVRSRTSIVPFQAILEGRQKLPADYYKEFLRLPYVTITLLSLGTYWAHPLMQSASHWLGW